MKAVAPYFVLSRQYVVALAVLTEQNDGTSISLTDVNPAMPDYIPATMYYYLKIPVKTQGICIGLSHLRRYYVNMIYI